MSGINVADLITEFIDMVGVDVSIQNEWTGNSNEKILRFLNRSYWELLNQYPFKATEAASNLPLLQNSNQITLPPIAGNTDELDAILGVNYIDSSTSQSIKLKKMTRDEFQLLENTQVTFEGPPEYYYSGASSSLVVLPYADQNYTLLVWYSLALADLVPAGTVAIPREWHELILYGAVHRALLSFRDYEGAAFIKNMQTSMVNDKVPTIAKENVDNRFSGLAYGKGVVTDNGEFRSRTGYYGRGLWR